jgi:hypothetical protein
MLETRLLEEAHRAYELGRLRAALRVSFVIVPIAVVCAWETGAVARTFTVCCGSLGTRERPPLAPPGRVRRRVERLVVRGGPGRSGPRRVSLRSHLPARRGGQGV